MMRYKIEIQLDRKILKRWSSRRNHPTMHKYGSILPVVSFNLCTHIFLAFYNTLVLYLLWTEYACQVTHLTHSYIVINEDLYDGISVSTIKSKKCTLHSDGRHAQIRQLFNIIWMFAFYGIKSQIKTQDI